MRSTLILLFICLTAGCFAQHSCCEPPAFSFDDLPKAIPLDNRGNGKFSVNSQEDSVQFYVDQGFNLFHNFNYFEAYTSFERAASIDTLCLGALLGKFLIFEATHETDNPHYIELGRKMEYIYDELYPMSNLEYYLFTPEVDVYYVKKKALDTFMTNSFDRLLANNIEDPEAYVWYLRNLGGTEKADSFAELSIEKFPNYSPLIHYVIHLWEERLPEKVMQFKKQISALAPESGHLTHMPGHIYFFNGLYALADSSFKSSFIVDSTYNAIHPDRAPYNWNIVHNIHFIYTNLIEMGKLEESDLWLKKLVSHYSKLDQVMYDSPEINRFDAEVYDEWRRGDFETARSLAQDFESYEIDYFPDNYYVKGLGIYFEALNHFVKDSEDSLELSIKEYTKHHKDYLKNGKKSGWKKTNLKNGSIHKRLGIFEKQLEFLSEISADKATMSATYSEINKSIEVNYTNDPSTLGLSWPELASLKYEKIRDYDKAIELLIQALKKKPNSGIIHLNLARLYLKAGQKSKSKEHLNKFHIHWAGADKNLLEFEKARVIGLDLEK